MSKIKYVRYRPTGMGSQWCIETIANFPANFQEMLESSEFGDSWEVEPYDISDEEYKKLPEHSGF